MHAHRERIPGAFTKLIAMNTWTGDDNAYCIFNIPTNNAIVQTSYLSNPHIHT